MNDSMMAVLVGLFVLVFVASYAALPLAKSHTHVLPVVPQLARIACLWGSLYGVEVLLKSPAVRLQEGVLVLVAFLAVLVVLMFFRCHNTPWVQKKVNVGVGALFGATLALVVSSTATATWFPPWHYSVVFVLLMVIEARITDRQEQQG